MAAIAGIADPVAVRRTERLLLRPPGPADRDFIIALFSRAELVAHRPDPTPDPPEASIARLLRDITHWQTHGFGRWAIEADVGIIGFGGVTVTKDFDGLNLSYHLQPENWGRGFAGELVHEALAFAFGALKAEKVIGLVRPANPASRRVLERAGFSVEREVDLDGAPTILLALDRRGFSAAGGGDA